ncbi:MAG: DUF7620 family protein [Frankiaceae bacterium]
MRWWRRRKQQEPPAQPSEDAQAAVSQVKRAHKDADRLLEHITEVTSRAHQVAAKADEVRSRNHFGDAVRQSMRRVQHP